MKGEKKDYLNGALDFDIFSSPFSIGFTIDPSKLASEKKLKITAAILFCTFLSPIKYIEFFQSGLLVVEDESASSIQIFEGLSQILRIICSLGIGEFLFTTFREIY